MPLGLETYCDIVSIELLSQLDLSLAQKPKILEKLNKIFPRGMEILEIEPLQEKLSKTPPKSMLFTYKPENMPLGLVEKWKAKTLPVITNHRGQEIDLNDQILEIKQQNEELLICLRCNNQGA